MKPARALDLPHRLRRQLRDAQSLAQLYADHLQLCRRHLPTSYSLARSVHGHMIRSELKPPTLIINTLVGLYVKFNKLSYAQSLFDKIPQPDVVARNTMISAHSSRGHMRHAREVFDQTPIQMRDVVCYNALIGGYARNGDGRGAVMVFKDMVQGGFKPDNFTLTSLLSGLSLIAESERECEEMHCLVLKSGTGFSTVVLNALLALYCTCASSPIIASASCLNGARRLFDEIPKRDAYTWNAMITANSCLGHMKQAREVFDQTPVQIKNVVSYNALIGGYARNGDGHGAFMVFKDMVQMGFKSDNFTLTSLLSGLSLIAESERECEEMHCLVLKSGTGFSTVVLNALLVLYCTCASSPIIASASLLNGARRLFDEIPERDAYTWNTMITANSSLGHMKQAREVFDQTPVQMRDVVSYSALIGGYARNGDGHGALMVFKDMVQGGFKPDNFTLYSLLSGLRLIAESIRECEEMHCLVLKSGTHCYTSVLNALLALYVTCANSPMVSSASLLNAARRLFDEIPERNENTWTTMIIGFMTNNDLNSAFEVLIHAKSIHAYLLRKGDKYEPHALSCINSGLITVYCKCGEFNKARHFFNEMLVRDLVSWNAMLSGYMNYGCISEAKELFGEMPEKDSWTWNIMVSGLARNGCGEETLGLLNQMKLEGFEPCDYTFAGAISACSLLAALEQGRQLHAQVVRLGYESSLPAGNSLITMYSECGVIQDARLLFLAMPFVCVVSWNAIIAGLGQNGHGEEALDLFEIMLEEQIPPDRITYLHVIAACSYAGLVKQGEAYFNSMQTCYGITPGEHHYGCMIDLLCRAGKFSEAKKLLKSMPFEPSARVWRSFLSGCKIHGNLELGIEAAEHVIELIPKDAVAYVLLANMYADAGKWDQAARVKKIIRDRGVERVPGCSWIEVESNAHMFIQK